MEKLNTLNTKEAKVNKYENLDSLNGKFENIINNVELEIAKITGEVLEGVVGIIQSTEIMQKLAEDTMFKITDIFSKHLGVASEYLPFTLFFFGSPARNLMLPNSDLDIGLVYTKDCNNNLKKYLEEKINLFPFDKIDIAD
jgi:predicted nucleotidyltransferase